MFTAVKWSVDKQFFQLAVYEWCLFLPALFDLLGSATRHYIQTDFESSLCSLVDTKSDIVRTVGTFDVICHVILASAILSAFKIDVLAYYFAYA